MNRLYDRILARGTISPSGAHDARQRRKTLEEAVVLAADEVAEYFFSHATRGPGEWDLVTDMPAMSPPFASLFVESAVPHHLSAAWLQHLHYYPQLESWGALFETKDMVRYYRKAGASDPAAAAHEQGQRAFASLGGEDFGNPDLHELLPTASGAGARWLVEVQLFLQTGLGKKILCGFQGAAAVIAADGAICPTRGGTGAFKAWVNPVALEDPAAGSPGHDLISQHTPAQRQRALAQATLTFCLPLFLALSLCGCKNVSLEDHNPDPRRSRRHRKKHRRPLITYKTLRIEGMRELLRTEGRVEEEGLKRALHLCRGHFRTYTPERGGPFGRRIDAPYTEWVTPHLRGRISGGLAVKDYTVESPAEVRRPDPDNHPEQPTSG